MIGNTQQDYFITPELTHRSELILHLLEYSEKLVVVIGELDSGKTTFFNALKYQNESNLILRSLTISAVTNSNDIFKAIIVGDDQDELHEMEYSQIELNQWLMRCQNKQETPVLLIDNADLFNDDLIAQLFAILQNANEESVLHIGLFCEPTFLDRLKECGIDNDSTDSLHIIDMPNLSEAQAEQYIRQKYPPDKSTELNLFDEKTVRQIHRISHGLPGRINALCEQYLDDPAKKTEAEIIEEKKPKFNIKNFVLKNKSVISVVVLLLLFSVGVATLLRQTEKEEVTQTIKLNLPKQNEEKQKADDVVKIEVPKEQEAEPVTIEELSPPVIPEIAKDLNDKSGVSVYNSDGHLVSQESDIETVVEEVVEEAIEEVSVDENVIEGAAPIITINETLPEPEPEPEPEPIVDSVSAPEKRDINWLIEQDSKKYVLQLIGAYEQETIDVYLKSFKDNQDNIISFTASNKGKEWHILVYGLYDTRDQAVAAIDTLPTRAKLMAPWPRTVQSIKDLVK